MIAVGLILALVVRLLAIYLIALYNGLVEKRNRVDNAWAQIEVQLKRRHDLIPNLVETVKGYAAHERGTFEAVTQARAAAVGAQGPAQTAAAEGILGQALGRLFAVAEAYPDLKAKHQLPRPPDAAAGHGEQDRRLAAGLQRHGADLQQRDPGVPGRADRRPLRLHEARVLRDRGRRRPRGADGQLPAGRPGSPGHSGSAPRRRCTSSAERRSAPPRGSARRARARRVARRPSRSRCRRPIVSIRVAADGGVVVDEHITYAFSRPVHRRLPGDPACAVGESIDDVRVSENGRAYRPGGCAELELRRRAGNVRHGDRRRRRCASSGTTPQRTSSARSTSTTGLSGARGRLRRRRRREPQGLGLRVGGAARSPHRDRDGTRQDPPRVGAPRLRSRRRPARRRRRCSSARSNVPAGQFVELRTVIPRAAFTLDRRHACGVAATVSQKIVAEETADAAAFEKDQERIDHAKQHPWRYAALPPPARDDPRLPRRRRGVLVLRTGADDGLRPRVRAGAADRDRARPRPDAPPPGRRGRLVRVHRDAVRPDPAGRLHLRRP